MDLFFVLSGFLIGGILMDHRESSSYFSTFYMRRICRILPVYVLLVGSFIVLVVSKVPQRLPALSLRLLHYNMPLWSYATFTQNIQMALKNTVPNGWAGITWSLAVEEQFHLLLPLVIYFLPRKSLPYLALAAMLLAPPLRYLAEHHWGWFAAYVLLPCRMDSLMAGVLAGYILRQESAVLAIRAHLRWLYIACAATFVIALAGRTGILYISNLFYSAFAVAYALALTLAVCDRQGMISRLFNWKFLTAAGTISYGIYMYEQAIAGLWHALVLGRAPAMLDLSGAAISVAALVTAIAFSYLSYRFYELPFRNWGKRFKY